MLTEAVSVFRPVNPLASPSWTQRVTLTHLGQTLSSLALPQTLHFHTLTLFPKSLFSPIKMKCTLIIAKFKDKKD